MSGSKKVIVMDRRMLLQRIAAVASAAVWSGDTLAVALAKSAMVRDGNAAPRSTTAGTIVPLSITQLATLATLTDVIIPATDTPGAREAGVPEFIADMYRHWMTDEERTLFGGGLAALDAAAQAQFNRGFAPCSAAQQAELFGALRVTLGHYRGSGLTDRIADPTAPFFYKARDLTTLGYFTSELGVTKELAYVPVPGRFEGDIDIETWHRQMQL